VNPVLSPDDQRHLLRIARRALQERVEGTPGAAPDADEEIGLASGAFVSIHRRGALRGCLGRVESHPLGRVIADLARAVADSDPRFEAVSPDELGDIDIEISVLTPEREIESPDRIDVGRHGLIVEQRGRRGLLLPQVAAEHGWDRLTFLEYACLKAGLPRNAWEHGARVFVFEAQVFGEADRDEEAGASDSS
jgi:AmmeMemoRadiSam system protein A